MNSGKNLKEIEIFNRVRFGGIEVACLYPNSYDVGMSNLGFQWLLHNLERDRRFCARRFFIGGRGEFLFSPDTDKNLSEFKYIFISISYELDYLNLIRALKISKIFPLSKDRKGKNILIGGGVALSINFLPVAKIFDLIVVGEGEGKLENILNLIEDNTPYNAFMEELSKFKGRYFIPLFEENFEKKGRIIERKFNFADEFPPFSNIVSSGMEFSNTFLVEISRGCPTMCRFCWAGFNLLPPRNFYYKKIEKLIDLLPPEIKKVGIVSTAIFEHREIFKILDILFKKGVNVNFSSFRLGDLNEEVFKWISRFSLKTLTIAPETGNYSLRRKVNKNFTNEEILEGINLAFRYGITNLKLYFLVGLPHERKEDIFDIVSFVKNIRKVAQDYWSRRGFCGEIVVSINPFVPKPGTPFQYFTGLNEKNLKERISFLKSELRKIGNCKVQALGVRESFLQWGLSFGTEKLLDLLIGEAYNFRNFKKFRNNMEFFKFGDGNFIPYGCGISEEYLLREREKSFEGKLSSPCPFLMGVNCNRCGICK